MKFRALLVLAASAFPAACGFIEEPPIACDSQETRQLLSEAVSARVKLAFSEAGLEPPKNEAPALSIELANYRRSGESGWRGRLSCEVDFVVRYPGAISAVISGNPRLKGALGSAGFESKEEKLVGVLSYESALTGYQKGHVVDVPYIESVAEVAVLMWRDSHPLTPANEDEIADEVAISGDEIAAAQAPMIPEQSATQAQVERRGPSFDCAKASTAVEKMICDSPELSGLDMDLADAYRREIAVTSDRGAVKRDQVEWLRSRLAACEDSDCVRDAYVERIQALSGQRDPNW